MERCVDRAPIFLVFRMVHDGPMVFQRAFLMVFGDIRGSGDWHAIERRLGTCERDLMVQEVLGCFQKSCYASDLELNIDFGL